MVAVIGTLLALRQPNYWYVVAAAVGAGALQKAPVAALLVGTILVLVPLTKRYHELNVSEIVASKHFLWALLLAVVLIAFWPALQTLMYGPKAIEQQYIDEMFQRFNPIRAENNAQRWFLIFAGDEAIIWIAGLLSILTLPFLLKIFEAFVPLIIVVGVLLLMGMATGFVHHRYTLLIMPILAASLAALLTRILPGRMTALAVALGFSLLIGAPSRAPRRSV